MIKSKRNIKIRKAFWRHIGGVSTWKFFRPATWEIRDNIKQRIWHRTHRLPNPPRRKMIYHH